MTSPTHQELRKIAQHQRSGAECLRGINDEQSARECDLSAFACERWAHQLEISELSAVQVETKIVILKRMKLKNRRLFVGRFDDGDFLLRTVRLVGWKKFFVNDMRFTRESAMAIVSGFNQINMSIPRDFMAHKVDVEIPEQNPA